MGARQSKRSLDIAAGKEGEVAVGGEVAGAGGAAGEGRLERIEDADAAVIAPLKPQLNGDAPHTETIEISDKEKQLQDNGTPENEKDNTTEKDVKEKEDKDKEIILSPVNGSGDEVDKENGDSKAAEAENNKKNKKVKKKWSLRSISFSKKDKQKPDKQKKDETNGDCDKVPEESAEATAPKAEVPEIMTPEETQPKESPKAEEQDKKTPETPVTEPITNGSSAPETPKEEVAAPIPVEVPVSETKMEVAKEETVLPEPEQLPISDLKIEDAAVEPKAAEEATPVVVVASEPEAPLPEEAEVAAPAPVPAAPAPVASEVCVAASSVEDAVPPPLPVNPPPSSLTAFATTTMAPHLVTATAHDPPHTPRSPHSSPAPIPEELEISEQDKAVTETPIEAALSESVVTSNVTPSDEPTEIEPTIEVASIAEVEPIAEAIPTEEIASSVEIVTADKLPSTVDVTPILDNAPLKTVVIAEDVHVAETYPVPHLESNEIEIVAETVSVAESPVSELVVPCTQIEKEETESEIIMTDSEQSEKTVDATVESIFSESAVAPELSLPVDILSENSISDLPEPEPLSEPSQVILETAIEQKVENDISDISKIEPLETDSKVPVEDCEPSAEEVEAIKVVAVEVVSEILESVPASITPIDKVEQNPPTLDDLSSPSPNGRHSPSEAVDIEETLEEASKVAEIVSEKIAEVSVESATPVSIPEMTNGDTVTTSGDAGTTE